MAVAAIAPNGPIILKPLSKNGNLLETNTLIVVPKAVNTSLILVALLRSLSNPPHWILKLVTVPANTPIPVPASMA